MSKEKKPVGQSAEGGPHAPRLIVGVGASPGGLEAFQKLLQAVPERSGLVLILVQPLDPGHSSQLPELLSRYTSMKVEEARGGAPLVADHVYTIPPETDLEIVEGKLAVSPPVEWRGVRWPIDHLLRSLAREYGPRSAGVLLSGTEADGAAGLQTIRAAGGLALVEQPEAGAQPHTPQNAPDLGGADLALPPAEIPAVLVRFSGLPSEEEPPPEGPEGLRDRDLGTLGAVLKAQTGFDLRQYKPQTVRRRVWRRMKLAGSGSFKDYLALLHGPEEAQRLVSDLLIGVTNFFRDPEAFEVLKKEVLTPLVQQARQDEALRVWVAGCATGEEAYSIAILLREVLQEQGRDLPLQIFATDADPEALKVARAGIYPASIAEYLSRPRLEEFFRPAGTQGFQVRPFLRDTISFALHDLCTNPPFSRMHLISCRNVLIYLRPETQQRLHGLFHFALQPEGALFLGPSESPGEGRTLFTPLSSRWRIYRRVKASLPPPLSMGQDPARRERDTPYPLRPAPSPGEPALRELLRACLPPSIIVGKDDHVLYVHGQVDPWLEIPQGEPRAALEAMLREHLKVRVRSALYQSRRDQQSIIVHAPEHPETANPASRITIHPVTRGPLEGALIISFERSAPMSAAAPAPSSLEDDTRSAELERELIATRRDLRNTLEETESAHEELKSAHEESLSMNEELQSTNEELEATTEELRSTNEELSAVNARIKEKIAQLQEAHDDLANFFASTKLATVFLDEQLGLKRMTPAAEQLLRLREADLGRHIEQATQNHPLLQELSIEASSVLEDLTPKVRELRSKERWLIRQVLPYRTAARQIEGVVVTFSDVTEIKQANEKLASQERQQAAISRLGLQGLVGGDPQPLMEQAVREVQQLLKTDFCEVFELLPDQKSLLLRAGVGWRESLVGRTTVPASLDSQAGYTLLGREPVLVEDLQKERRFSGPALLLEHEIKSGVSCIIRGDDGPYGVLGAHTRSRRVFTRDDSSFLMAVANIIATAVARQRTEALRAQLAAIVSSSEDAILSKDPEGIVQTWNRGAERLYGYAPGEIIGKSVSLLIPPNHPDEFPSIMARLHKGDRVESFETVRLTKDGRQVTVSVTISPILDHEGRLTGASAVARDITRLKETERALREANQHKDEYLAMLSHELRNPLAALLNAAQLQKRPLPPEALSKTGKIIERQTLHMASLVDGLLDVSRIAQGKIDLKRERIDLRGIVREVASLWRAAAEKAQLALQIALPGEEVWVYGDPTRLTQILDNLLNNAVKFTQPPGQIQVRLSLEAGEAVLRVKDTGIGIEPGFLGSLFEPFRQARQSLGRTYGGLGLGLALVKGLAELHGGGVQAFSAGLGHGTEITVRLPLSEPPTREEHALPTPPPQGGLKILVVEDNQDTADSLQTLLSLSGHEVRVAYDGEDALKVAREMRPEVILCDIGLPGGMTGYEVASALREDEATRDTYLVALTGYGQEEDRARARDAGFHEHLIKPASFQVIEALLARLQGGG